MTQVKKISVYKKSVSMCINSDHAKVLRRIRRDRKISAPAAAIRYKWLRFFCVAQMILPDTAIRSLRH